VLARSSELVTSVSTAMALSFFFPPKNPAIGQATTFFYQSYLADPDNYEALIEWVKVKVQRYEKNFAIKFVLSLARKDPKNPNHLWAMGEIYLAADDPDTAINYFHRALDLDNRHSHVRMVLAKALEKTGKLRSAVAEYRLASMLDSSRPEGFYRAAEINLKQKRFERARTVLEELIKLTPRYPGAHRYLSKIYAKDKKQDKAIAEMEIEVKNHPSNTNYRIELAELYLGGKKNDKAIAVLTDVTNSEDLANTPQINYSKVRAYLLLSKTYRSKGQVNAAEGSIRLALQLDSTIAELHRELGYVYQALQQDKAAIRAFKEYLTRKPAEQDASDVKKMLKQLEMPK